MRYRRTQVSPVALVAAAAQGLIILGVAASDAAPRVVLVLLLVLIPITLVFSRLTVEVAEGELRFWFGGGFWKTRIPLSDIASIERVQNQWWWGWGIRYTPDGWLYNVSGVEAIRVTRKSGSTLRIGCPEPRDLARAVDAARR
jgi:hypothetical protein